MGRAFFYSIYLVFSALFAVQDIRTGGVPRAALWLSIAASLLAQYFLFDKIKIFTALAGCGTGLFVFTLAYYCSKKQLGLADVWYAALIGSVFGPLPWFAVIALSCVSALTFMLIRKERRVPYIPFMAASSALALPFFERAGTV